jgi:imidazoleglycerol phosphate synthase cyclase subunit
MDVNPRLIPALLLQEGRLVKTRGFEDPVYVGDPTNVLSIFNDLEVDEIMLLDIGAARSRHVADIDFLKQLASECFVPLSYGGGIESVDQAKAVVKAGIEKIVVNSQLVRMPGAVVDMVAVLGSQAIVGAVDVRRSELGDWYVYLEGASRATGLTIAEWVSLAEAAGVGEILVTSVEREGTRTGIDLDLVRAVTSIASVPVIAHGGAGSRDDLTAPILLAGASAVAAGSAFVFQSGRESVVINYPPRREIDRLLGLVSDIPPVQVAQLDTREQPRTAASGRRICSRCLITDDVPGAAFDEEGICYYCRLHDELDAQYPTGPIGRERLEQLADSLKRDGRNQEYDCILGVSGGCDSSYLAHLLVEMGVRPLAVHFDNTWNSPTATSNIFAVLNSLKIDLETYVADNEEYDDIYRSFLLAGVRDVEAPTDIGFMGVLYRAAEKHGIRHIVEGHSFRTEGVSPLGWLYMDGGYVKSVHKRYGRIPMRTYPNMEFGQFVRWAALSGIERHRPLYFIDYQKESAKAFLSDEYGWQWYGGHHLENRFTAFYHTYLLPTRFGIDFRLIEFSALVRSGQLDRDVAAEELSRPREPSREMLALVQKRMGFDEAEFERVMTQPHHTYREFHTYKRRFELLRPFFWALYKAGRVPKSFYVKFCT